MENFYSIYDETYLNLLPSELKALLFKYIYGPFYIRHLVGSRLNSLITLHIPILNRSEVFVNLPFQNKTDLKFLDDIPVPIPKHYQYANNIGGFSIANQLIYVGNNAYIILAGNDANIFLLKLKQLYHDLITLPYDELYLRYFYY